MAASLGQELEGVELGDRRLEERARRVLEQLSRHPGASFAVAGENGAGAEALYRFFSNEAVKPEALLAAHAESTWQRAKRRPRVLVAQDTTVLDYTRHRGVEGIGVTNTQRGLGIFVHSALALTEEGAPLGVIHQERWVRPPEAKGKRDTRRERPWEEKESYKWQRTVEAVAPHLEPGQRLIVIGDRESDVYGLLASPRPAGVELLVRSAQNRKLREEEGCLHEALGCRGWR